METKERPEEGGSRSGMDRRSFLVAGGGTLAAGLALGLGAAGAPAAAEDPFKLPPLPYASDALEPSIDKATMEIHHGKHHQAYITNLNKALAGRPEASKPIEEILRGIESLPAEIRTAVRNHGGGHHNHSLFWTSMKPHGGGDPAGKLGDALKSAFGGVDKFKAAFTDAATKHFGSGWAWLVSKGGKLEVLSLPNQDSPLMQGAAPLLGLDVWEHAYYLKYQNRRPEYITAWWSVVNWDEVAKRLA